jgi:hypothetical protein
VGLGRSQGAIQGLSRVGRRCSRGRCRRSAKAPGARAAVPALQRPAPP